MLDKEFKQLRERELWKLQKIYKKQRKAELLTDEEQQLHDRFLVDWLAAEKKQKAMIPIVIFIIIGALFRVLRHHL